MPQDALRAAHLNLCADVDEGAFEEPWKRWASTILRPGARRTLWHVVTDLEWFAFEARHRPQRTGTELVLCRWEAGESMATIAESLGWARTRVEALCSKGRRDRLGLLWAAVRDGYAGS